MVIGVANPAAIKLLLSTDMVTASLVVKSDVVSSLQAFKIIKIELKATAFNWLNFINNID